MWLLMSVYLLDLPYLNNHSQNHILRIRVTLSNSNYPRTSASVVYTAVVAVVVVAVAADVQHAPDDTFDQAESAVPAMDGDVDICDSDDVVVADSDDTEVYSTDVWFLMLHFVGPNTGYRY